jgi:hypothetical protein
MRRYAWVSALAIYACSKGTSDPSLFTQPTRVRVSPSAFLGDTPCSDEGGMQLYQATLFDVTDGLDAAFALPSSDLVACTADAEFEYVKAGRYYIAEVRGFDRSNLRAAAKGAPLAVDDSGAPVPPRWETTCYGQDGVTPQDFGLGGATGESAGGMGGAAPDLGVRAFSKTIVTVRGCEPLTDGGTDGKTRVSIAIEEALVDLGCGSGEAEVGLFRLKPSEPASESSAGGAGGAENTETEDALVSCGEPLLVEVEPGGVVFYEVQGLSEQTGEVIWETTCEALPRAGITVSATCDPARSL